MSDKTLHLLENLMICVILIELGAYALLSWAGAADMHTKAERVAAYYSEGMRTPGESSEIRVQRSEETRTYLGRYYVTGYDTCAACCGKTDGITASGTPDACSFLYSAAARVARELGYERIVTYILDTEPGTSLRAAGWHKDAEIRGKSWDTPSRRRQTTAPTCDKQRWVKELT